MCIGARDHAAREAVGTIANARAQVRHGGRRHADGVQPRQTCYACLLQTNASVVENQGVSTCRRAKIRRDQTTVRAGRQHRTAHCFAQFRNRFSRQNGTRLRLLQRRRRTRFNHALLGHRHPLSDSKRIQKKPAQPLWQRGRTGAASIRPACPNTFPAWPSLRRQTCRAILCRSRPWRGRRGTIWLPDN